MFANPLPMFDTNEHRYNITYKDKANELSYGTDFMFHTCILELYLVVDILCYCSVKCVKSLLKATHKRTSHTYRHTTMRNNSIHFYQSI